MQLWSSITDPVKAALVAGSLGVIGIILTQAITTALQLWINSHRSKQERKALEVRFQHERENFKLQIEHEERERSAAIKREKIEELYRQLITISRIMIELTSLKGKLILQKSPDTDSYDKLLDSVHKITTDMDMIVRLYIPELSFEFNLTMLKTIEMTRRLSLVMAKIMAGDTHDMDFESIGAEDAELRQNLEGNISDLCGKMQEMMSIYIYKK